VGAGSIHGLLRADRREVQLAELARDGDPRHGPPHRRQPFALVEEPAIELGIA
jgi:hypothetical protein